MKLEHQNKNTLSQKEKPVKRRGNRWKPVKTRENQWKPMRIQQVKPMRTGELRKNKPGETDKNHNCQQSARRQNQHMWIYICMVSYKELGEYLFCALCLNAACLPSCFLLALPSLVIGSHGNIKHGQRPWQPNTTSATQSDNSKHKHIQWQHLLLYILEATLHNLHAIKHSTWFIHDNPWQPVKTHSWVYLWVWVPLFVPE